MRKKVLMLVLGLDVGFGTNASLWGVRPKCVRLNWKSCYEGASFDAMVWDWSCNFMRAHWGMPLTSSNSWSSIFYLLILEGGLPRLILQCTCERKSWCWFWVLMLVLAPTPARTARERWELSLAPATESPLLAHTKSGTLDLDIKSWSWFLYWLQHP